VLAAATRTTAPTLDELASLTYTGILAEPIRLRHGEYLGKPAVPQGASRTRVRLARSLLASGDLDGDGTADAAVLLSRESGGSGTELFLALVTRREGRLRNVATAALGDRLALRAMAISERSLTLDVVTHGPSDPLCCPMLKQRWHLHLDRDRLVLDAMQTLGQLSMLDLEGVTWRLASIGAARPVPDGVLVTAVFASGEVSGAGGCNRYVGLVTQRGFQLQFGPLAATRMTCQAADETESAYFDALGASESFSFSLGRLAITYTGQEGRDTLVFEAVGSRQ
jgi:heat shock protein HslJ